MGELACSSPGPLIKGSFSFDVFIQDVLNLLSPQKDADLTLFRILKARELFTFMA